MLRLAALYNRFAPPPPAWTAVLPQPQDPVCLVGDLHGRDDLLTLMLDAFHQRDTDGRARLIFAGDMIDRGPDSARVLRRLYAMTRAAPGRTICLMGNHERMLLDMLDNPEQAGPRWLASGGTATLDSLDLGAGAKGRAKGTAPTDKAARMTGLAIAIKQALGPDLCRWLQELPLFWQEGNLMLTHAGTARSGPVAKEPEARLLWGRGVSRHHRRDGSWLAQGHRIVPQLTVAPGRIWLDTGAYRSGRLSALWLGPKQAEKICIGANPAD